MRKLSILAAALALAGCGGSDEAEKPVAIAELCKVEQPSILQITTDGLLPVDSKDKKQARKATFVLDGTTYTGEIRGRGNSTWGMPKKPYRFKLDAEASLGGMAPDKNWVLLANYSDKTMLRTALAWCVGRLLEVPATPESHFVEVELNGQYVGLYQLTWQIDPAPLRIPTNGGYLAEIDARADGDVVVQSRYGPPYVTDKDMGTQVQLSTTILEKGLDVGAWTKYVDLKALAGYYVTQEFARNNDAFWSSTYFYQAPGEKIKFGPLWDFDLSFGNYEGVSAPEGWHVRNTGIMYAFIQYPEMQEAARNKWRAVSKRVPKLLAWLDEAATVLAPAAARNFDVWPILGTYVWPNVVVTGSYDGEVAYLKNWISARQVWLDANF